MKRSQDAVRIGTGRSASVRNPRRRSVTLTAGMPEASSRFGVITKLVPGAHETATPTTIVAPALPATVSASAARLPPGSPRNGIFRGWSPRRADDRSSMHSTATGNTVSRIPRPIPPPPLHPPCTWLTCVVGRVLFRGARHLTPVPEEASGRSVTPTTPLPSELTDSSSSSATNGALTSADSSKSEHDDSAAAAAAAAAAIGHDDSIGPLPSVSSAGSSAVRPRRRSGIAATLQKHIMHRRPHTEPGATAPGASPPLSAAPYVPPPPTCRHPKDQPANARLDVSATCSRRPEVTTPGSASNPNSPNLPVQVAAGTSADAAKPRMVNFAFSALTTSSNAPTDMMDQVRVQSRADAGAIAFHLTAIPWF